MEPAAPGTEDEVQVTFPVYSKKASETDRLLSLKSFLPNGAYGNIFELSYVNGSEHWYCNMCECPVMGRVYHHEIGKRHSTNVANCSKRGAPVLVGQPVLHIAAGEPVPPGFEGELQKSCQIQERLDNYTVSSLVGLEYLLEIQEYDRDKEPSYLCMLCDKRGDPRTVIAHLVSYNHISQYLQRHFVKCYQALSPYMTKQYKRNWQNTMNKIAEAIEQKYGRLRPHPVEKEGFEEKKPVYWAHIFHGPHFSDKDGVTFEHLISREEITKIVEDTTSSVITKPSEDVSKRTYRKTGTIPGVHDPVKKRSPSPPVVAKPTKKQKQPAPSGVVKRERRRSLSSVSSISSSDLSDYNTYENKKPARYSRSSRSRSRSPYRRAHYERSPSPRTYREKGSVLPWQRPDYIKSRNEVAPDRNKINTDKLEEYKKLAAAIENDMEKTLKQHERNPEKHPQYNDEWKVFWNKRYKELQAEGKDATNYDFKPEWIVFWNKRMVELHNGEIKAKKDALRRRLGLPEQPAPICFRITGKKKSKDEFQTNKPAAPMASEPDQDHEVIVIEDKDEDTKSSKRSHSPWESEPTRPSSRVSRERSRDRDRERSYERRSRERERSYERGRDYKYKSPASERRMKVERSWEKSWERDSAPFREAYRRDVRNCYKPPPVMRDVTRQPVFTPPRPDYNEEEESDTTEINIVAVLRLLTALEEKLGSLGPKIIDMLAQALAMEKNEANSSESLLDNDVNCVLFETVKEKLKGQLLAGLVDYAQERAFKNAIKKIASLIHYANQRKEERKKEKPDVDPVKVPGIGTVDKAAIAKQIATALVLQGKTDVTQAELEQLINAVVGMAEASKTSGKPMTTASFIEQFNQTQATKKAQETASPSTEISEILTQAQTTTANEASSSMEGLSDSDLQTLLQNFKDLSTEEQHGLITYLKKLESKEPERVERLRKFVNLGPEKSEKAKRSTSPFSARLAGANPTGEDPFADAQFTDEDKEEEDADTGKKQENKSEKEPAQINIDSEEEEYSFDDVFQAANKKVKEKEMEKERQKDITKKETKINLSDAKALIANIMGSINAKESSNLLGLQHLGGNNVPKFENTPVSAITTGSIVQAMDKISPENVKNLENIVGNLQSKLQAASDANRCEDKDKIFPSNFQATTPGNFRTNFNINFMNNEPQTLHVNPDASRSPQRNQIGQNAPPNNPSNVGPFGQGIRLDAPNGNRVSAIQQNVQYPMKNIYGGYTQNPQFSNQANFNRAGPPFGNQNFGYDNNRYGYNNNNNNNNRGNRQGGNNYGGNRW